MKRLVSIEALKLRTTPALWVAIGLTVLLSAGPAAINVALAGTGTNPPLSSASMAGSIFAVGAFTSMLMLVMGVLITAGEDRHRTNLATFLGEPRRVRVLVAKLVTAAGLGALIGAVAFGSAAVVAVPVYVARSIDIPVNLGGLFVGTVLVSACFALLGVALGALTRNTVGAILGGLGWALVVELAILPNVVPGIGKWLPTGAGMALTRAGEPAGTLLSPAIAALVLVGWAAAICLVASQVSLRREVR